MAVIEQEVDAVFLWLNGVIQRAQAQDFQFLHSQLEATWRTRISAQFATDLDRRFLGEFREASPGDLVHLPLHDHALDHSRAIAKDDEGDLPLGTEMRDPPLDSDGSTRVRGEIGDPEVRRCHWIIWVY